ncbi:MAG: hypothetical protein K5696_02565 [Lachnospiraceae bacterium]|nr:hypothetical protein [Lachnospiraceae bacterium]
MDAKTVRLAVLLSISAIALILLVVYAANTGNRRHTGNSGSAAATADGSTGTEAGVAAAEGALQVADSGFVAYGELIGNQPRGFLYDESFFDPMRDVRGISDGSDEQLTLQATVNGDSIHLSVINERGGLESGVAFQVTAKLPGTGRERTWTDTDRDGQLDMTGLENGSYRLYLLGVQGYEVPSAPVVVKIDQPLPSEKTDATGGASGRSAENAADGMTGAGEGGSDGTAGAGMPGEGMTGALTGAVPGTWTPDPSAGVTVPPGEPTETAGSNYGEE